MHASTSFRSRAPACASTLDFVTALSAEARCELCNELHAAVDQRRCARCGAANCPDCASLGSQASSQLALARASEMTWICHACAPRAPVPRLATRERRAGALASSRRLALVSLMWASKREFERTHAAAWRQLRSWLEPELRRLARNAGASTRRQSARAAHALNVHAVGFVLGTAILVAVARADDRHDLH